MSLSHFKPIAIHIVLRNTQCSTYCTLVQEAVVEFHKLFFGLFSTEVFEEFSMKVAELRGDRDRTSVKNSNRTVHISYR